MGEILNELRERSDNKCELCGALNDLNAYEVPPAISKGAYGNVLTCHTCLKQLEGDVEMDKNHWHCLNESMWSEQNAVKVVAWRMLTRLNKQDLLDMLYLEDDIKKWAEATGEGTEKVIHRDSNGVVLQAGDSVVLIKDLPVKGSSMIAKRGTAVRRISLDHNNANYIEGKVDGQHIVIVTEYVKKV